MKVNLDRYKNLYMAIRKKLVDIQVAEEFNQFEYKNAIDISQNLFSFSFLFKSIFYTNSSLVYLVSFINCFQNLKVKDETSFPYSGYTHSLTIYLLKRLEREGIIVIESCERRAIKADLHNYYQGIGNSGVNRKISMFDIRFHKLRSLKMEDFEMIAGAARMLRADLSEVNFNLVGDRPYARLKRRYIARNILNLHVLKQELKYLSFEIEKYKLDRSDLEDMKEFFLRKK